MCKIKHKCFGMHGSFTNPILTNYDNFVATIWRRVTNYFRCTECYLRLNNNDRTHTFSLVCITNFLNYCIYLFLFILIGILGSYYVMPTMIISMKSFFKLITKYYMSCNIKIFSIYLSPLN